MKIVINTCYGGFGLSAEALERYRTLERLAPDHEIYDIDIPRNNPNLVQVVEQMGDRADGDFAKLKIVEVPDDVNWYIEEYDGREWVAERHRTWE